MLNKKFNSKTAERDWEFLGDMQGMNIEDEDPFDYLNQEDEANAKRSSEPVTKPMSDEQRRDMQAGPKGSGYLASQLRNIRNLFAHNAFVDRSVRKSVYACPNCKGEKDGGKKKKHISNIGDQDYCPTCRNHGHTLLKPEESLLNINEASRSYNEKLDFHNHNCTSKACHNKCPFKEAIDENCRKGTDRGDLRIGDTHYRSSSTNPWVLQNLKPKISNDGYKGYSPVFDLNNRHEDDPIEIGDAVQFVGWDTVQPDANLGTKGDRKLHKFKQTFSKDEFDKNGNAIPLDYCEQCGQGKADSNHTRAQKTVPTPEAMRGKGPGSKTTTGFITNVSNDGRSCDAYLYHTSERLEKLEYDDRMNGEPTKGNTPKNLVKRTIGYLGKAMRKDTMDGINYRADDSEGVRRLQTQITSSEDEVGHLRGTRSPVAKGRWTKLENVPTAHFIRLSPLTAALTSHVGTHDEVVDSGRIQGAYPGTKGWGIGKRFRAAITTRVPLGISTGELRDIKNNTNDPNVLNNVDADMDRMMHTLGIPRGHHLDIRPPAPGNRSIPKPTNEVPGGATKPEAAIGSFDRLQSPNKALPQVEVPGRIKVNHSQEHLDGVSDVIKQTAAAEGRTLTPEEHAKAIEGYKNEGHINGGLRAIGLSPEDTKDDDNEWE
jgi:hypothetical protein